MGKWMITIGQLHRNTLYANLFGAGLCRAGLSTDATFITMHLTRIFNICWLARTIYMDFLAENSPNIQSLRCIYIILVNPKPVPKGEKVLFTAVLHELLSRWMCQH
jgi:hypothetical protein